MNYANLIPEAYDEGREACIEANGHPPETTVNPYPEDSPEWRSWNYGWNTYP